MNQTRKPFSSAGYIFQTALRSAFELNCISFCCLLLFFILLSGCGYYWELPIEPAAITGKWQSDDKKETLHIVLKKTKEFARRTEYHYGMNFDRIKKDIK